MNLIIAEYTKRNNGKKTKFEFAVIRNILCIKFRKKGKNWKL